MNLSIIIPARNEAAGIAATLAPLQAMRSRGVEVIVVDGGSADATKAIAQPLADGVVDSAPGRARQMNAGARVARGDALLFLHADSRLPDSSDEAIRVALQGGAHWGRFDVDIAGRHRMLRIVAAFMNARSRLTGIATGDQGLFATRAAFERIGGFPDQVLMEDIELCRRLKALGPPACLRARLVTSGRRWESRGVWRTIVLMWRLRLQYFLGASPEAIHRAYYGLGDAGR